MMKSSVFSVSLLLGISFLGSSTASYAAQSSTKHLEKRVTRIRLTGPQAHKLIKSEIPPIYPEEASKKHIQGIVRLHIIIGMNGLVNEINVVSGKPQLQVAAVDAVRQWKYEISRYKDQPVEVETAVDLVFKLK